MPDRLDKELEDILGGGSPTPEIPATGNPPKRWYITPLSGLRGKLTSITIHPGKFMLTSVALLLVVLILYNSALSNAGALVWVAVALFAGSYLLFFVNPNKPTPEKRWRGEVIESQPTLLSRFQKWLGK